MGYVIRRIEPLTQEALDALGLVLRRLRAERGLSQVALADRSGVHQSTISRLESGKAPWFKVVTLAQILAGLERGEFYVDSVRLEPATPGWQQMMASFSAKSDFAARIAERRTQARLRLQDRMPPHASGTRYEDGRRAQRRRQRPTEVD